MTNSLGTSHDRRGLDLELVELPGTEQWRLIVIEGSQTFLANSQLEMKKKKMSKNQ